MKEKLDPGFSLSLSFVVYALNKREGLLTANC